MLNNYISRLHTVSTVDIETVDIKGKQLPVLISHFHPKHGIKLFEINLKYFKNRESERGIKVMFNRYFKNLEKEEINLVFAHNLGGFDGYYLFKYLYYYSENKNLIKVLIDDSNKFIKIGQNMEFKEKDSKGKEKKVIKEVLAFKDSMRLLGGVSLNTLCKIYGVQQKLCEYKFHYLK